MSLPTIQPTAAAPRVAIVGRPNVGKSSLLNTLAGRRISIVAPTAGVTRDRVSAHVLLPPDDSQVRHEIEIIDTGGYGMDADESAGYMAAEVQRQIATAAAEADLILMVVDAQAGVVPLDREVAHWLRQSGPAAPILLVANKVDSPTHEPAAQEASSLGFGAPIAVSATSGFQKLDLLDAVRQRIDWLAVASRGTDTRKGGADVCVAIVGKRNAGKSTLVNSITGGPRLIVSAEEGTTRDAVDVRVSVNDRQITLVDTAGLRKRKSLADDVEYYSHHRAMRSVRRADVVIFLIDASVPLSQVDRQLGQEICNHEKPCVVGINKWDLAKAESTQEKYVEYLDDGLKGLDFAPIAFVSAARSEGLRELLAMALNLYEQASCRVTTGQLNRHLEQIIARAAPKSKSGKLAKIYYAAQTEVRPPTVRLWVNHPEMFDNTYQRFLINRFRDVLPFSEVPIRLLIQGKKRLPEEARRGNG